MSFDLTRSERKFLAKRLRSLSSPRNPGARSIFSLLVGHDVSSSRTAWSPQVRDLAETERPALERAGHAAALAAIGRGVYAAQVETLCEELDRSKRSDTQRAALTGIVQRWKSQAARLDWTAFLEDMRDRTDLPPVVSVALHDTLAWVRAGYIDPMRLERVYRDAEEARKGRRARLSRSQFGVDQRADWDNDLHPLGAPLHYRWDRVQMLLQDLVGA